MTKLLCGIKCSRINGNNGDKCDYGIESVRESSRRVFIARIVEKIGEINAVVEFEPGVG